jgi:4'-phosphopantetheinyl transferase EntD
MPSGRSVKLTRLPRGIRNAAARRLEAVQSHALHADLLLRKQVFPVNRRESILAVIERGEGSQRERVEFVTAELAQDYGLTDIDGRVIPSARATRGSPIWRPVSEVNYCAK